MKIVGVAGKDRSGKDTVAELFIEAGYFGFSFGDAVRKHAIERHEGKPDPISVENMTETANWLRSEYGPDVILKQALDEFYQKESEGIKYKGVVLYSVRAPIEADFIIDHGGELVWVESSDKVRYKRKINNLRRGEAEIDIDEMLRQEDLQEQGNPNIPKEVQMKLSYVKSRATIVLENNGSEKEEFLASAKKALGL